MNYSVAYVNSIDNINKGGIITLSILGIFLKRQWKKHAQEVEEQAQEEVDREERHKNKKKEKKHKKHRKHTEETPLI